MNRRRLLQLAALAPIGPATIHAAYSPLPRTGKARFTPTLNAYSFLEQLNANIADPTTGIDLFGVCDFCVKQDIEAVDLTGYFFPGYPKAPTDDSIARIKRYTHERGITISGTGVNHGPQRLRPRRRSRQSAHGDACGDRGVGVMKLILTRFPKMKYRDGGGVSKAGGHGCDRRWHGSESHTPAENPPSSPARAIRECLGPNEQQQQRRQHARTKRRRQLQPDSIAGSHQQGG
jgi:hypothetical protein